MSKSKKRYVCRYCGAISAVWLGKCPSCGQWNTFEEEIIIDKKHLKSKKNIQFAKPLLIKDIPSQRTDRFSSSFKEFDRVLGGGFVPGSLVLLGGEPGIGKSTLALQTALNLKSLNLYVCGEESPEQIKIRSERLNLNSDKTYFVSETIVENLQAIIKELNPSLVVVDSIQTLKTERIESTPGSITQIREITSILQQIAKEHNIVFLIIGHITKGGAIAGPKILEHIVDTVLYFGGEKSYTFRILRTIKNRFGPTSELAIFQMYGTGLEELRNPSEILLSGSSKNISGVAICSAVEGIHPLLIEVQALVSPAVFSAPQRVATGFDSRRLSMLLAVIEKRIGIRLGIKDVFVNIAGGIKVNDTALDFSVAMAIISSDLDIPISEKVAFAGEISLAGEIKPVYRTEQRITEAEKLGFRKILISDFSKINLKQSNIEIIKVRHLKNAVEKIFQY